jgi:hypothetical protein
VFKKYVNNLVWEVKKYVCQLNTKVPMLECRIGHVMSFAGLIVKAFYVGSMAVEPRHKLRMMYALLICGMLGVYISRYVLLYDHKIWRMRFVWAYICSVCSTLYIVSM